MSGKVSAADSYWTNEGTVTFGVTDLAPVDGKVTFAEA